MDIQLVLKMNLKKIFFEKKNIFLFFLTLIGYSISVKNEFLKNIFLEKK